MSYKLTLVSFAIVSILLVSLVSADQANLKTKTTTNTTNETSTTTSTKTTTSTLNAASVKPTAPEVPLKFFVFSEQCFDLLVNQHEVTVECFKFTLSKTLGLGIVFASIIVKVPQILKIIGSGSVKGLSLASVFSEILMFSLGLGYNLHYKNPFSTFGEQLFLLVQTLVILIQFGIYSQPKRSTTIIALFLLYGGVAAVIFGDLVPENVYPMFQTLSIAMNISARVPQILMNFVSGSTGQLAFITTFLNFAGSGARVFTTVQEVNDQLILGGIIIAFVFNLTIFLQMLYYWNSDKKGAQTIDQKTEPKSPKKNKPKRE